MTAPPSLEQKFMLVINYYQNEEHQIWLKGLDGLIKIESRPVWRDGLNSSTPIRIINQALGASYAPRDWSHIVRLLELYKIDLDLLEEALDYRINVRIVNNYTSLLELYDLFEKEYVDSVIKSKGRNLNKSVKHWYNKFFNDKKPVKSKLTLIKGDKE